MDGVGPENVYGAVPPAAARVTLVVPPKVEMVPAVAVILNGAGWLMVTDAEVVVPVASLTVTV